MSAPPFPALAERIATTLDYFCAAAMRDLGRIQHEAQELIEGKDDGSFPCRTIYNRLQENCERIAKLLKSLEIIQEHDACMRQLKEIRMHKNNS